MLTLKSQQLSVAYVSAIHRRKALGKLSIQMWFVTRSSFVFSRNQ